MFLDYLREKETDIQEKINLKKKELSNIVINIKENRRFSEMLEKSKATPFTEFTPQVITATDKRKQESLFAEEEALLKKQGLIEDEIALLEEELRQVSASIKEIKKAFADSRRALKKEREYVISKINSVLETNISDPMRGNIELKELVKFLNDKQLP